MFAVGIELFSFGIIWDELWKKVFIAPYAKMTDEEAQLWIWACTLPRFIKSFSFGITWDEFWAMPQYHIVRWQMRKPDYGLALVVRISDTNPWEWRWLHRLHCMAFLPRDEWIENPVVIINQWWHQTSWDSRRYAFMYQSWQCFWAVKCIRFK